VTECLKVLVSSASPDRVNYNAVLRHYVGEGFAQVLGADCVMTCSLDHSSEAARRFQPDLVLVFGSCMPDSCDYTALRTYCGRSGASLAFWLHDDPYEFDFNFKIYGYADIIFSNDRWAAEHINHPRVVHLPLAADHNAHFREIKDEFARDLFFCGAGFSNRISLLADCAPLIRSRRVEVLGSDWPASLNFCQNQRVPNASLPDYYASSRLTLNVGRRFNLANSKYQLDASTPGPRTFEAAMSGAVQCMYFEGAEILDYFVADREILLFDSPSELKNLLEEMEAAPDRRRAVAVAAQRRVLAEHTYAARARKILSSLGYPRD